MSAVFMPREIPWLTRRGEMAMAKLRLPDDRQYIHWLIFNGMLSLEFAGLSLAIPKQGDPRLVSHQLELQGKVEDVSVRMGVDELIGAGKIVVSEPAWVDTQESSRTDCRVLYGSLTA
jgi:hypothetical protein